MWSLGRVRAAADSQQAKGRQVESEEALTDKMAEFLRKQAEKESGVAPIRLFKFKVSEEAHCRRWVPMLPARQCPVW